MNSAARSGASAIEIWGTGQAQREFLHVDDLADACVFLMERYAGESHLNIGTGTDVTINHLAELIAETVGWSGGFIHQPDRPDGTPRKLLDVSRLASLGWKACIPLEDGIASTYRWYLDRLADHITS